MLNEIVDRALAYRAFVLIALAGLVAGGVMAWKKVPVDAFPDVTPVQVGVVMEAPGMAAEDVERLITFPIESVLTGLPGVQSVRSTSIFGLSSVNVYFRDDVDVYAARHLVFERLQQAKERLPDGLGDPALTPNASGLGQVYWYTVDAQNGALSATALRTVQDWSLRPALRTAAGVDEVISWGGHEKQYQVLVDPERLARHGLALRAVTDALAANNRQVGGEYLALGPEQVLVRGQGLISGVDDLAAVMVGEADGVPIYLRDVATLKEGVGLRLGAVTREGQEAVMGMALQRIGENAKSVVEAVKQKLATLDRSLPKGVTIRPVYDRTELVDAALTTAVRALVEGALLVAIVLYLFLGNLRPSLVVILTLPLALLVAFILMQQFGLSANLMSLAGLAVALGMIIDGAVVMVENAFRHLANAPPGPAARVEALRRAAHEVMRPVAFAILIIIVVFLPLFTLTDVEGKMFKPMAIAITFAMLGSLLLSAVAVPVLASFALKAGEHRDTRLVRWLGARYERLLAAAQARQRAVLAGASLLLVAGLALIPFLGREFMPTLQEGTFLFRISGIPSASLDESIRVSIEAEKILARFPQVATTLATIGRSERGEPEDVNRIELLVGLKPRDQWGNGTHASIAERAQEFAHRVLSWFRPGAALGGSPSYEALGETMQDALQAQLPTVVVSLSQPIQSRVEELISGIRAPLALKIYGEDLATLDRLAQRFKEALDKVPGVSGLSAEANQGKPQMTIKVNRPEAARYGLSGDDILDVVQAGIGGKSAGAVLDGATRFDIQVWYQAPFRASLEAIRAIPIRTRSGAQVPLSRVADITVDEGYSFVRHEQLQRFAVLQMAVNGRDINGFVADAQAAIERTGPLPPGYRIDWGGAFENQQRALARLAVIVPLTIGIIFMLLYAAFGTWRHAALIIANVPFALVGGVVALAVSGQYLSVPSSIGFIAVFGIAMLNGIVLVALANQLVASGEPVARAATAAAQQRLRPILMTAAVTILGLLPMLLSQGIGAETQRPLATVVVGGLFTSTALTLFLLPMLYEWVESRARRTTTSSPEGNLR